jgi:hypothetical protein
MIVLVLISGYVGLYLVDRNFPPFATGLFRPYIWPSPTITSTITDI